MLPTRRLIHGFHWLISQDASSRVKQQQIVCFSWSLRASCFKCAVDDLSTDGLASLRRHFVWRSRNSAICAMSSANKKKSEKMVPAAALNVDHPRTQTNGFFGPRRIRRIWAADCVDVFVGDKRWAKYQKKHKN